MRVSDQTRRRFAVFAVLLIVGSASVLIFGDYSGGYEGEGWWAPIFWGIVLLALGLRYFRRYRFPYEWSVIKDSLNEHREAAAEHGRSTEHRTVYRPIDEAVGGASAAIGGLGFSCWSARFRVGRDAERVLLAAAPVVPLSS
jgi:hypothetical protein